MNIAAFNTVAPKDAVKNKTKTSMKKAALYFYLFF